MLGCTGVNKSTHQPAEQLLAGELSFNAESGEIRYTLPEPALVRIRIGRPNGGALLRTLADWDFREKGPHIEVWDKKDPSGSIDLNPWGDFVAVLACQPVGSNQSVLPRGLWKSPDFDVEFLSVIGKTEDGFPVISGNAPIRITVADKDKPHLTEIGFEIVLYVDQVFLIEGEKGLSPFNYVLNTDGFNEGYHFLTINVATFSGEVGTKTFKFLVKKS